jgi:hypothetical protein
MVFEFADARSEQALGVYTPSCIYLRAFAPLLFFLIAELYHIR